MDYFSLVSNVTTGKTIRVPYTIAASTKSIRALEDLHVIIDTGADSSAISKEILKKHGYGRYTSSEKWTNTTNGRVKLQNCAIQGMVVAKQFKFPAMHVNVLEQWDSNIVIGVIGMDILSQLTFILSHELKKFLLTNQKIPELCEIMNRSSLF